MRGTLNIVGLCLCLISLGAAGVALPARAAQSAPPQVVDRIVAHIEDDIITQSEVRGLSNYQELVDGHAESITQDYADDPRHYLIGGQ